MTIPSPTLRPARRLPVLLALVVLAACGGGADEAPVDHAAFRGALDLEILGSLAVHSDGRLKSFDSHAASLMQYVTGPRSYQGASPAYTYLELMANGSRMDDADVIYVKKKVLRGRIAEALRSAQGTAYDPGDGLAPRLERFLESGLISERLLMHPNVQTLLMEMRTDLIRTAKDVEFLESALAVKDPMFLLEALRIVPPKGDRARDRPWLGIDLVLAGEKTALTEEETTRIRGAFQDLLDGWRSRDAERVNAASATLASTLPEVNPGIYPSVERLRWESWYFRSKNMTWVWVLYLLSIVPLLLAVVYRWPTARRIGLAMFVLSFGVHTFALGLRWYVSQRWPNSNMFEAVTTSAWFGGVVALVLEWFARRSPMRSLFALGSAAASMVALMAAYYMPVALTPAIGNMMPVLHDLWLYIHTNVIIASYCLIFMAAISGLMYLAWRMFGGGPDHATAGGAGALMGAMVARPADDRVRLAAAGAGGPQVPVGPQRAPARADAVDADARAGSLGRVFDGVTMVLMELSFVMLWAGIAMGAIWADHSWGRPWGWDPKEVFALNTFLVFAVLIHVRFKSRDKGLWTACLAVIGAGVMLFNWIVINFVISGLHSYA